jgi:mercuric ion transport protein
MENVEQIDGRGRHRSWAAIGGGVLGAIGASACCILPLVFFSVGISGAWIANLTALAPYHSLFVGFSVTALAIGYYFTFRKSADSCAEDQACARPLPDKVVKFSLWSATFLIAVAGVFPYIAPMIVAE